MHYPHDPVFPNYRKPELPLVLPDHGVSWQRWFWRSWGWLIITTTGIQLLYVEAFLLFAVLGLLISLVLGFWVCIFTTLVLYKRQIERHAAFWFSVHYAAGAAIVVAIFYFLTASWRIWSFDNNQIRMLSVELPMINFIVASALVGWNMQEWFKFQQLDTPEVALKPKD